MHCIIWRMLHFQQALTYAKCHILFEIYTVAAYGKRQILCLLRCQEIQITTVRQ